MYINLEGESIELSTMTRGYLVDTIRFYKALCHAHNSTYEERKERKRTRDALIKELKTRHRTGHKMNFKPLID